MKSTGDPAADAYSLISAYHAETGRQPAGLAFGVLAWERFRRSVAPLLRVYAAGDDGDSFSGVPIRCSLVVPADAIVVEEFAARGAR